MDSSTPGFPVHHQLPELAQTHVHWVGDATQPSHSMLSLSPHAFKLSQHHDLFEWVSSSHQVAKVLEFQLQQPIHHRLQNYWKDKSQQTRSFQAFIGDMLANITLPTDVCLVKAMVFPVVMYGCESWTIKKAECRRINAFELWCWRKTLESPLDCKEIQPVNPKGNQSWIFIGRTDAEAEASIVSSPDVKNWLLGKDPDAGKDWRQEEKGTKEYEMVAWCHRLDGHEFEQALGVGDEQGSLACCGPWGHIESDTTEQLNWTELTQKEGLTYPHASVLRNK